MQTDFKTYSTAMLIGQIADSSLNQIDSYAAEATILFGTAVKRGTKKDKQVLPNDGITEFLGIALRDDICRSASYPKGSMVSVMTKGRVVVRTTEAVVAGEAAYVHADGTFNKTATDGLEIGIFASTQALDNELVILEIK